MWFAFRSLRKQPGFTAVAVLTLAVGIGASTAVFSVVDATMLRPLRFPAPDRLMQLSIVTPAIFGHPQREMPTWSYPKYQTLQSLRGPFEDFAAYNAYLQSVIPTSSDAERVDGEYAEAAYFRILGVRMQVGRAFVREEDTATGPQPVVVLSDGLWRRKFGGDAGIAGKDVVLEARTMTVLGVAEPGFRGLSGRAQYWLPVSAASPGQMRKGNHVWNVIARRQTGITEAQAKAAMSALGAQVDAAFPDTYTGKHWGASAQSFEEARIEPPVRSAVFVFFGAVAFVLLVACANVANLLLARGASRRREIAIRQAIGGTRGHIVRQLMAESALLACAGCAAGVLLGAWGVRLLSALSAGSENPLVQKLSGFARMGFNSIAVDGRVLLFSIGAAALCCLLCGLVPACRASRSDLVTGLKAAAANGPSWSGGTRALVVAEIAFAVVLVASAGLLMRSFGRLLALPTGIDPDNLLTLRLHTRGLKGAETDVFFDEVQSRIGALPGVVSTAARDSYPLSSCCSTTTAWLPGRPAAQRASDPLVGVYVVSPGYFQTMRIRLLRGRLFTSQDRPGSARTLVISESAGRRFFPGQDPLGKRLAAGDTDLNVNDGGEIVGVVADVRNRRPEEPDLPSLYVPAAQAAGRLGVLFVRTAANPTALAPLVRDVIRAVNPRVTVLETKTMRERISDAGSKARLGAGVLGIFATIALALASIGVYGVMACFVVQRTREMGIRMALGAPRAEVVGLVVRRAIGMTAAGLAIGIPAALALTRMLASLLYEVRPADPASYAGTALVLAASAVAASWIPARRAASAEAAAALRAE